ncbi:hypothetical protein RD110_12295 [Rhodoferax koreense]|uniref:Restriction endonuclease type IV Mrr domain-containing protein n=2 Tax=Rhodoferax koreensis TaxID=1842727 RepID=A0A1P8K3R7_9BURK|nr:hypothetical protein RD110_12295 [Rhodoferax koreense]
MAHGSLFAILLRSPWWISLGIAAAIVAAARTSLPSPYFVFGAMGALPFVVICGIAAWRQLTAPSPTRVAATIEKVAAMSWRDFSSAVESAFAADGYAVTRLAGPAADFAVRKDGRTTLVSCKRWKAASVGTEALRDLSAAQQQEDASAGLVISLGALSEAAQRFAKERGIVVMQGAALAQLLRNLPAAAKPAAGGPTRR